MCIFTQQTLQLPLSALPHKCWFLKISCNSNRISSSIITTLTQTLSIYTTETWQHTKNSVIGAHYITANSFTDDNEKSYELGTGMVGHKGYTMTRFDSPVSLVLSDLLSLSGCPPVEPSWERCGLLVTGSVSLRLRTEWTCGFEEYSTCLRVVMLVNSLQLGS